LSFEGCVKEAQEEYKKSFPKTQGAKKIAEGGVKEKTWVEASLK